MTLSSVPVPATDNAVLIRPRPRITFGLSELWQYRELLYFFVWRDVKVRYKQTVLGIAWAVIQPLAAMLVFSLFFGRLAKIPSDGVPYPLFAYCGLVPWQLFAFSLSEASNSVVNNHHLIQKVFFPRLVTPVAAVCAGLVDFSISFVLLLGFMAYYHVAPHALYALPLFLLLAMATALTAGIWLAALNVEYRDVRYVIPFLTQFWLLATPVAYPASLVPQKYRPLLGLNPIAGVVQGFRWALLGTGRGIDPLIFVSAAVVAVGLLAGILYFRRMERTFADVV